MTFAIIRTPQGFVRQNGQPLLGRRDTRLSSPELDEPRNVAEMIAGLRRQFDRTDFCAPDTLAGDGIVYSADGKYWPMVVVAVRLLRELGCTMPVQIHAWQDVGADLDADQNTTIIRHAGPIENWWHAMSNKTLCIMESSFRRVLWLDADAYCVVDPSRVFSALDDSPCVIWTRPENYYNQTYWEEWTGVAKQRDLECQGGHWLFDVRAFWRELSIARWIDERRDYFYRHFMYNDEATMRLVITEAESPVSVLKYRRARNNVLVPQFDGQDAIVHRLGAKLWPDRVPKWNRELPLESRVQELYRELVPEYRAMVFSDCQRSNASIVNRAAMLRRKRQKQLLSIYDK